MATPGQLASATQSPRVSAGTGFNDFGKIRLSLRSLTYEKELAQLRLPRATEALINSMLRLREQSLEVKYNLAFHFTLLKKSGDFWKQSGHPSLDAWLSAFDLPLGATLAAREAMVKLFSKETFLLAGDDILGEMIFQIAHYQQSIEMRKRDYQKIFDAYCRSHDSFDKGEFRKIIHWYINTHYVKPSGLHVVDNTAKPQRLTTSGRSHKVARKVEPTDSDRSTSTEIEFVIEPTVCAGCSAWQAYAESLETIIRNELGAKRLPHKPKGLV